MVTLQHVCKDLQKTTQLALCLLSPAESETLSDLPHIFKVRMEILLLFLLLLLRLDRQTGDSSHLPLLGIDKSAALPVVLK